MTCECIELWKTFSNENARIGDYSIAPVNEGFITPHPACKAPQHQGTQLINEKTWPWLKPFSVAEQMDSFSLNQTESVFGIGVVSVLPGYKRQLIPGAAVGFQEASVRSRAISENTERWVTGWNEIKGRISIAPGQSVTNGCAFRGTFEEAKEHACLELIERHVVMEFWESGRSAYEMFLRENCEERPLKVSAEKLGHSMHLYRLTTEDSEYSVFLCRTSAQSPFPELGPPFSIGAGASRSNKVAALKAMQEAVQSLFFLRKMPAVSLAFKTGETFERTPESHMRYYWNPERAAELVEKRFSLSREKFQYPLAKLKDDEFLSQDIGRGLVDPAYGCVVRAENARLKPLVFGMDNTVDGLPHMII